MTPRERADRRAAALAERQRRRDEIRASLVPVARLAQELARSTRGHPVGDGEPIKVRVRSRPAETEPERMLPCAIEIDAHMGATLKFTCSNGEPGLVVEQDLRNGRWRDRRVFDRIDSTLAHGGDGPYMLYPNRKPVSVPAVLLHFEEIATM